MASLFVIRGRDQGKHFQLLQRVTRIGRDATNDVQLLDNEASRGHAEIRADDASRSFELIDLGSSNGTLVNGTAKTRHRLASGDRVEIGGTLLIFTGGGQVSAMDAAHGIDIVHQVEAGDASQIISSLSRHGVSRTPTPTAPASGAPSTSMPAHARQTAPASSPTETAPERPGPPASDSAPATGELSSVGATLDSDRSLEVMYLTALAVGRTDDLDQVLDRVLRLVFDWVEADRGCIMLRDPETKRLIPAARCDRNSLQPGDSERPARSVTKGGDRIAISHTILDYVIREKEGVRTSDAIDDKRFDAAASIVQGGVREALCVPLQGRYDIVGALYVDTYTTPGEYIEQGGANRFHDEHLRLTTAIGHQAALAIEDTFYYSALLQGERLAAMGQTIATLSHHIKNILQGVRGGSYLIETGLQKDDTEAIRRGWAIVDRNQERISNLVLDMLTFSKERQPQLEQSDWNSTISDVAELMRGRAGESGVSMTVDLQPAVPPVQCDAEAMHRAVLNLVTNAIDAAVSQIAIRSRFEPDGGWIVEVEDDGEGVPMDERAAIFSLFESKKGARGTGLGLPVSAKILAEHGGTLEVDDSPLGGARFRAIVPTAGTEVESITRGDTIA